MMDTVIASVISISFPALLGMFFYRSYVMATDVELRSFIFTKKHAGIFVGFSLLILLLCFNVLSQNRFIYFWDLGGYWTASYTQAKLLFADPFQALQVVYASISHSEYNLLLPMVISLPIKVIGNSFVIYVLINFMMFIVPTWLVLITLFLELRKKTKNYLITKDFWIAAFFVVTFTPPLLALLSGYIDAAALLPVTLLFLLLTKYDPTERMRKQDQLRLNVVIAANLLLAFLFRRYFAFFDVGYIAALVVYAIILLCDKRKFGRLKDYYKNIICNIGCILMVAGGVLCIFFPQLVFGILGSNYAMAYTAYDRPFLMKWVGVVQLLGGITLLLALIGTVFSIKQQKNMKLVLAYIISFAVTILLFMRIQTLGVQHEYIIIVQLAVLAYLGYTRILEFTGKWRIVSSGLILILLLQPMVFFSDTVSRMVQPFSLGVALRHTSLCRNDISELHSLEQYLIKINPQKKPIYILASGSILNSSIMFSLEKPDIDNPIPGLLHTADVDLRDGFPTQFLTAEYVVVANPVQLHLREGTQEVVRYLQQKILVDTSMVGRHYEKLDMEFTLDDGVKVNVYRRTTDYTDEDLYKLNAYYAAIYPGQDKLFKDKIFNREI